MKPAHKSPKMEEAIEHLTQEWYGKSHNQSIIDNICVECSEVANEFTDALSIKEFSISGLCQQCQDKVFLE